MNISKIIVGLVASAFIGSAFAQDQSLLGDVGKEKKKVVAVRKIGDKDQLNKVAVAAAVMKNHKGAGFAGNQSAEE